MGKVDKYKAGAYAIVGLILGIAIYANLPREAQAFVLGGVFVVVCEIVGVVWYLQHHPIQI